MVPPTVALLLLSLAMGCACAGASVSLAPAGLSENRRHFVDARGKPRFWLGDTQWDLFLSFTLPDAQAVLDDRQRKGFNAIQVMLLGVGGGKKANVEGAKPFLNDDVTTPNEAYFSRVDTIVGLAGSRNLALVIGIYHQARDYKTLITPTNARAWGRWIGARYRSAPNVIWSMYPAATSVHLPIVRELAAGLAEGDGGRHLITVHPDPAPASSSWIHDEPWLAFNTLQSFSSGILNYRMVTADYARVPVKPVVNGEARYEAEEGTTPAMVRNSAYWAVLAGGFYTFGHGGNWMNAAGWRTWLDSPGSRQMNVLGDFFAALDWWTLKPDLAVISGWPGDKVAARAAARTWAVVYLPAAGSVTVHLSAVNAANGVEASWTDPATGASQAAGTFASSGRQRFTAPAGYSDALLLLRSKPRN